MALTEEQAFASRRGKWSQPGVPHKGWRCVGIEDLLALDGTCEMCESQMIRHVQYMQHPDYEGTLGVGCVCAGHMEQDRKAAEARAAHMVSRAVKRRRWLSRKWLVSEVGNPWLKNADGFRIVIRRKGRSWSLTIALVDDDDAAPFHDWRLYPTEDAAKLAAFDMISKILAEAAASE